MSTLEGDLFGETLKKVCKKVNKEHIQEQCTKIQDKYTKNPSLLVSLKFNDLLEDLDPIIWNMLVILTSGKKGIDKNK